MFEGSTNGGHFIARAVRRAFGLEGAEGTAFLDPYGEAQPARWQAFKAALDVVGVPGDHDAMTVGAAHAFEAVGAIGAELLAGTTA